MRACGDRSKLRTTGLARVMLVLHRFRQRQSDVLLNGILVHMHRRGGTAYVWMGSESLPMLIRAVKVPVAVTAVLHGMALA